ncbi:MAG: lactonase family protein [Chloroflexi bacterium]|nr:MAG: lactonase family protein [Chloroflexota bacterium]
MRKLGLGVALAFVLTCAPTALPRSDSGPSSASSEPIKTTDLITLREGGQQPALVVRKVATAEAVRTMPDGLLLSDGVTVLALERDGASTLVKKIDRRTGQMSSSQRFEGAWQLYLGNTVSGSSGDGSHVVLFGSSYNFTDESGKWTARTTFGVLDVAALTLEPVQLDGRFGFAALSNDGRFIFLNESTPVQLPTDPQLRVYDMTRHKIDALGGDIRSLVDTYGRSYLGDFAFQIVSTTETLHPSPDVAQVMPVTKLVRLDLSSPAIKVLRLPMEHAINGEDVLAWTLTASRDRKTMYVVNAAVGAAYEVDVDSLAIRRSMQLNDAKSDTGALDFVLEYLHPIAQGKMGFGTGAVLSPNGATLYVLGLQGIWSIDLGAFKAKLLARDGGYETLAISPDGARLYVLSRTDGVISAVDAKNGKLLGSMTRIAFPSEIVAVDAS